MVVGDAASDLNLRARALPFGSTEDGWINVPGTDALGRSILARIIVGTCITLGTALTSAILALIVGTRLGLRVGFVGGPSGRAIVQVFDILQSFPSSLMANWLRRVRDPRERWRHERARAK